MFLASSCTCLCPIQSVEARCWAENEDAVGAAPTGDAPTAFEWSENVLPKLHLILEFWRQWWRSYPRTLWDSTDTFTTTGEQACDTLITCYGSHVSVPSNRFLMHSWLRHAVNRCEGNILMLYLENDGYNCLPSLSLLYCLIVALFPFPTVRRTRLRYSIIIFYNDIFILPNSWTTKFEYQGPFSIKKIILWV